MPTDEKRKDYSPAECIKEMRKALDQVEAHGYKTILVIEKEDTMRMLQYQNSSASALMILMQALEQNPLYKDIRQMPPAELVGALIAANVLNQDKETEQEAA